MIIRSPEEVEDFLTRHKFDFGDLPHVYLGQEDGSFHKDWGLAKYKILFSMLWRYQDSRGNQTVPLLYQIINEWRPGEVLMERANVPETEEHYKLFRKYQIPLFGVESKHSAGGYDMIMTSLSYVPVWWNFPLMLKLSGIPVLQKDRSDEGQYPLIMVGGSSVYGNFGLVFPVVDIIYFGDAEDEEDGGVLHLLDYIMELRGHGLQNSEVLDAIQPNFPYIMCPRFYTPHYEKEKFTGWTSAPSKFPKKFVVRKCKNLDAVPKYTKPILSYTDNTMGLGEVEISRGCRGMCAFCGIGWKYRPYRERSVEVMVEALTTNKRNSGAVSLCPIATEFAYYSHKRKLINELAKHSRYVDPLSMRIDAFASDEEFDIFLRKLCMNQVALGVEGVSQRLRNRMMKGISEEEILKACKIAIEAGFDRAKFFMIANTDETWEDFEEFFSLLKKVVDMKNRARSRLKIRASWTPLFVEACTPLQWKSPTILQDNIDWKQVYNRLKELGIEMKYGVKRNYKFMRVSQAMHIGDTRFAEAVALAAEESDRPFYSGFDDKCIPRLEKYMEQTGYSWDYMLREKTEDEEFIWDVVDRGVKKETLLKLWKKIKSGEMDMKKVKIVPTMDNCELTKTLYNEQEAFFWAVVKYRVSKGLDTVPNAYWTAHISRAGLRSGVPLAVNKIHFFSNHDNGNWYGGFDYIGIGLRSTPSPDSWSKFCSELQPLEYQNVLWLLNMKPTWSDLVSSYRVETDISPAEWAKYRIKFDEADKVTVRNKETRYFSGAWRQLVDLKEIKYIDVQVSADVAPTIILNIYMSHEVGIRFALVGLLPGVSSRRIKKFLVEKTGLHRVKDWAVQESF
jgi:radical SAM superfamily enzyme YgiQ (UPF0313 family)